MLQIGGGRWAYKRGIDDHGALINIGYFGHNLESSEIFRMKVKLSMKICIDLKFSLSKNSLLRKLLVSQRLIILVKILMLAKFF